MKSRFRYYFVSMLFLNACSNVHSTGPAPAGDSFAIQPRWKETHAAPSANPMPQRRVSYAAQTPTVDAEKKARELGENWFYGQGVGEAIMNVGTVAVFPPYALYVLGNAGLKYAGLNPLYVTNTLPEQPRKQVLQVYDSIASVPGRVNATLAGENYRESRQEKPK